MQATAGATKAGRPAETTRDVLRRRAIELAGGRLGRRDRADGCHLALVIEGGGMRGVVAGGMVSALEELGLRDVFDTIHGSSAGACAGSYFLAGQAGLGTRIYYEDINNSKFIDTWRFVKRQPVMNTRFLIENVMQGIKVLDVAEILVRPGVLHIVATDVETGKAQIFDRFGDKDEFFQILRASITMPIIGGRSVNVRGREMVDGGMVQQIALKSALDAGATHILVLMTRKAGELERKTNGLAGRFELACIGMAYNAAMSTAYKVRAREINDTVSRILAPRTLQDSPQIDAVVRDDKSIEVGRLLIDAAALRQADQEARQAVRRYIGPL